MENVKLQILQKNFERNRDEFFKLPKRAQELILATMEHPDTAYWYSVAFYLDDEYIGKMTPIETTFLVAFSIYKDFSVRNCLSDEIMNFAELSIQQSVEVGNKKYILDFLFDGENVDNPYNDWNSEDIKDIKIAIECDGHDFHQKTKKQVANDNARELELKMHGFDVIRFSGSQIYKDPLGCAEKAYKYITSRIAKTLSR